MKNLRRFLLISIIVLLVALGLTAGYGSLLKMKRMAAQRGFQLPMRKLVAAMVSPKNLWYVGEVVLSSAPTIGNPNEVTLRTEDHAITINRTADQVFPFFVEPEKLTQWISGLEAVKALQQGPMKPGMEYIATYKLAGGMFQLDGEVDELIPDQRLKVAMEHSDFQASIIFDFLEHNNATTIVHSFQATTNSGTMMVAAGMIAYQADMELQKDLKELQRIIETRY